ncbi:RpoS [Methanosarcina siciliae T4/M]|uniref:RpoS n=1 Tax=Methanosarcina siciliae T4/M TaxID=1434120 RepID=A0A0E3L922_9EURY|nr:hypothetical protein [Methanosarcina siciliae]AKB29516.1 RpoS [Methanosarcina siciliae T4/M]
MKKYYTEREFNSIPKIELPILSSYFLRIYKQLSEDMFFERGEKIWGHEPEFFIFRKLGLWGIWPIEENIAKYEESTLFSVIELLHDYVSRKYFAGVSEFAIEGVVYEYDKKYGQRVYRTMVNDILRYYNGGYELSEDGEILKLSPLGFETLVEKDIETNDPENIDLRVKYSISKFSRYNSSIEDKKDAVRTLGDVLEYLGKFGIKLDNKDDSDLFKIINGFDIRHHNREQQRGYDKDAWYDWMFYTFLASIHVLLKLYNEKLDLKIQHTK